MGNNEISMNKLIIIIITVFSLSVEASVKLINHEIKFSAIGKPAFIKVDGSVPLVAANFEFGVNEIDGVAKVDLNSLETGIKLRDEHLKEKYLHTSDFPYAILKINKQKAILGKRNKIKALLLFHGRSKEISLDIVIVKNERVIKLNSQFEFLLSDFNVELPTFQGISAANKIKLSVVASFEK